MTVRPLCVQDEATMLAQLKEAFGRKPGDPTFARALSGAEGYQDGTPIFVVGLPRSGSSLIEQILASHPQAWGAGAALLPDQAACHLLHYCAVS